MNAIIFISSVLMIVSLTSAATTLRDFMVDRGMAIRSNMGIRTSMTPLASKGQQQPLLALVVSQSYAGINVLLEACSIAKYPRQGLVSQHLYFANTCATRRIVVDITYHRCVQDAENGLFGLLALSSASDQAICADTVRTTNGPGDLCVATRDASDVLFVRGNVCVRVFAAQRPAEGLLDFARWLDAQFARLSTNAAALKAADPCETNETPFAKFIVYDCPEPEVEPLPSTAQ